MDSDSVLPRDGTADPVVRPLATADEGAHSRPHRTKWIKILLVWLAALVLWEGSYRIIQWKSWQFPAPSHVVDATLDMLGVRTYFGDPLAEGWPWQRAGAHEHVAAGDAKLPKAIAVSGVRLLIGFSISLALGIFLGMAMWTWSFLDDLLGPLFLGLQTLPSVCWVPLAILTLGINESAILMV
ncbi:MAG: hypothetical protein L0Y44_08440, partial [Phycisphaerales bacterium]|nr:hypothetical protein [Phycisphaerales bacterium]